MKPFQVSISKLLIFQQHISFRSTRDFPTAWMKPDAGLVSDMCLRDSHGDYFFRLKHVSWRSMEGTVLLDAIILDQTYEFAATTLLTA